MIHPTVGANLKAAALGLAVSMLLVLFFSPSWASFVAWQRAPATFGYLTPVRRATNVIRQIADPSVEIQDPMHKIVRWRLLFPWIGHYLGLSPGLVLALSPLGCILVLTLVIGCAHRRGLPWSECALLAIVIGAGSWFFTATGWLGYFDSWLMLGLLTIAFARRRWITWIACLLTPWIDERVVMGFPLAILIRWLDSGGDVPARDLGRWFLEEALPPAALLLSYTGVRFCLAGRGGSQEISAYLTSVAFVHLPLTRLLFGGWEGLRLGWLLVVAAVVLLWQRRLHASALLLALATAATTLIGLASANDLSRSMMLIVPVIPLGWHLARSTEWWRRWKVGLALAVAALVLPAHHVVSDFTMPLSHLSYELRVLAEVEDAAAQGRQAPAEHAQ